MMATLLSTPVPLGLRVEGTLLGVQLVVLLGQEVAASGGKALIGSAWDGRRLVGTPRHG